MLTQNGSPVKCLPQPGICKQLESVGEQAGNSLEPVFLLSRAVKKTKKHRQIRGPFVSSRRAAVPNPQQPVRGRSKPEQSKPRSKCLLFFVFLNGRY